MRNKKYGIVNNVLVRVVVKEEEEEGRRRRIVSSVYSPSISLTKLVYIITS